ncbi:MAG: 30S ribosomal protein S4 [Armatimonadota bacterium]
MSSTANAVCRLCRREGAKLFLKGTRCYGRKCAFDRRNYAPGQHGQKGAGKVKDYGLQLREKQKMRRIYGVRERQFRNYLTEAMRRKGVTGENLLQLLEYRMDNIVFRLGFAVSRAQSRELVSHGHFAVNGKKVNTASYQVKTGDVIEVAERSKNLAPIVEALNTGAGGKVPAWLELNADKKQGVMIRVPVREEIDTQVEETLIVEFYSR